MSFTKASSPRCPYFRATINEIVAEGDRAWTYNTITGTHTGHGFLDYPPTNNQVRYDAVDMFRLRDGKLCEHWDVADTRALFTQVGAIHPLRIGSLHPGGTLPQARSASG